MVTAWNERGGLEDAIEILLPPSHYVAHIVQHRLVVVGGRFVFMKSQISGWIGEKVTAEQNR